MHGQTFLSSWDPYGHTNNIKVAVTSEDDGATVDGKELNLGNSLVEGLKSNKEPRLAVCI